MADEPRSEDASQPHDPSHNPYSCQECANAYMAKLGRHVAEFAALDAAYQLAMHDWLYPHEVSSGD